MPPPRVTLTLDAQDDLDNLTDHLLDSNVEYEVVTLRLSILVSKFRYLANNPMIGRKIEGLPNQYQFWLALDNKYVIYFKRTGRNSLKVLRVWGATRLPLGIEDLLKADE